MSLISICSSKFRGYRETSQSYVEGTNFSWDEIQNFWFPIKPSTHNTILRLVIALPRTHLSLNYRFSKNSTHLVKLVTSNNSPVFPGPLPLWKMKNGSFLALRCSSNRICHVQNTTQYNSEYNSLLLPIMDNSYITEKKCPTKGDDYIP